MDEYLSSWSDSGRVASFKPLSIEVAGIKAANHQNQNQPEDGEDVDEQNSILMWHGL